MNSQMEYFATQEASVTASNVLSRANDFYNSISKNGYVEKLRRMYNFYYGAQADNAEDHQISFMGEQGELVFFPVNHFRNIGRHVLTMITSNRPSLETRAANSDYKSMSQATLGTGILEYYMREKGLEDCIKRATELSIVLGAGYVLGGWNANAGEAFDFDSETGEINYQGDIEFTSLSPLDVVFDGTKEGWDHNWILVRTFKNRFDIIAKYPELRSEILSIQTKSETFSTRLGSFSNDETDDIPVYHFFHKPTESLPEGRYIQFCSDQSILIDTKLPYREIPVWRIVPSEILGTSYGYTPLFDLYPAQELFNSTISAVATNNTAFATQSVWIPEGSDFNYNQVSEGMSIIQSKEKPEAIQLTSTPPETFKFLELIERSMETISGVNSVSRGNPEASLRTGNALALVQAMSLQFMSELQQSYVKLLESVGSGLISILQDYATAPRLVALVGKGNRTFLKEFTNQDINAVGRVYVDVGNPLARTISGRVEMANNLMQMGLLKSQQQYISVLTTGHLDSMYQGEQRELLLIQRENEWFLDGKNPIVAPTDEHALHIQEHRDVLSDPDLRQDPELAKLVMDHIEQHMQMLENTDPRLLQIVGQQPIQPLNGGSQPGSQDPNQPTQEAMSQNQIPEVNQVPGGPEMPSQPAPATVDPNLLPNPELQEQSVGNIG